MCVCVCVLFNLFVTQQQNKVERGERITLPSADVAQPVWRLEKWSQYDGTDCTNGRKRRFKNLLNKNLNMSSHKLGRHTYDIFTVLIHIYLIFIITLPQDVYSLIWNMFRENIPYCSYRQTEGLVEDGAKGITKNFMRYIKTWRCLHRLNCRG